MQFKNLIIVGLVRLEEEEKFLFAVFFYSGVKLNTYCNNQHSYYFPCKISSRIVSCTKSPRAWPDWNFAKPEI